LAGLVFLEVLKKGPITLHRVQGAVAVYLLFGLIWAFAYDLVILHAPQAFHADELTIQHAPLTPTLIYFSFTTLTTVGYGDITPIHPIARSLAMLEAFVGQLFPAILIARLVAMELHIGSRDDVWIPILFTPMPSDLSVLGAYYFHSN
jgi:voltage-gated potassium channel Kch